MDKQTSEKLWARMAELNNHQHYFESQLADKETPAHLISTIQIALAAIKEELLVIYQKLK